MKNLKWILILVLMASLALNLTACGGEEPTATPKPAEVVQAPTDTPIPPTDTPPPPPTDTPPPPTDTPIPPTDTPIPPTDTPIPPTDTPEPTEEPEAEEGFDASMLEQPGDLDSFRSTMELSWTGTTADGTEDSGSLTILVEFVREPLAQHVVLAGELAELQEMGIPEGETLEIYVVDDTMYINMFGGWMSGPAEAGGLDTDDMAFIASEDLLAGLKDANYEGQETYNGIETKHYSFDETSFDLSDLPEGAEIEEASGNVYVAVEGNYVVHLDMRLSGVNLDLPMGEEELGMQSGSFEIVMDLSDINEPFTIEVPEEAMADGGAPEDIPMPPDAEGVTSLMGMITFQSPSSTAEITEFYQTQMPENGWTEVSVEEFGGMYMLEYSKDGRTASLMISTDSDTGQTSVLITVAEE